MKKNVLLIDDKPNFGGIAKHCHYLIQTLSDDYNFTCLVTNINSYREICDNFNCEVIEAKLGTWQNAKKCLDSIDISGFDLVHSHSTLFALDLMRAIFPPTLPIITTRHSVLPSERPYKEGYFLAASVLAMCRQENYKLVVVSEAVKEAYIKLGADEDKIIVINNAVEDKRISSNDDIYFANDKLKFLFIGRLSIDKDPLLCLRAFKKIIDINPTVKLDIIGDGPLRNEMLSYIEEYGLTPNINLLGFQDKADELISKYTALINSSPLEACSYTLIESLMNSRPIICSSCLGNKSIFNLDGQNLDYKETLNKHGAVFYTHNEDSLAEAILNFINEYQKNSKKINCVARQSYVKKFTLEKFKFEHKKLYEDLLK